MDAFGHCVSPFIRDIADERVEVYNEFSLQHELGFYLRGGFPGYKVQFERNEDRFFSNKRSLTKKEIAFVEELAAAGLIRW